MPTRRPPAGLTAALATCLLLAALSATPAFRRLEYLEFDHLTVFTAPEVVDDRIVIVGIDEPSFAELDMQWPWPRSVHGELIRALRRAGAAVVILDIVFAEPSDPEEDRLLAEAIRSAGPVVLASDVLVEETEHFQQVMRVEPHRVFREAGAMSGLSAVTLDADLVLRRIPPEPDSLWRVAVRSHSLLAAEGPGEPPSPSGSMIRYLGPDHTFPYVSYYQALEPESFLPPGVFDGRIVMVGYVGEMFATPYTAINRLPTPGVEIQATLVADALMGEGIDEVPRPVTLLVLLLSAGASALAMRRWRPVGSAAAALAVLAVLAVASFALFSLLDTWLPVSAAMASVAAIYVARGGAAFLHERRRKRQIRQAFGYYVSRQVVDEVIAHPEKLSLGGVRREITVMFTDLAGFTGLSETMAPEQVADLLNRHLTAMSAIVMAHGGTVDKFIGDAIMAFWGAPLEDPSQAQNACAAALSMQEEMERIRRDQEASGLPPLSMRVGIHSGPAVVGNMGSDDRFDYTAVGDNVNLASRLEGVNKIYGTSILVSGATADQLEGKVPLRFVDRVRVAGRAEPVDIHTPCRDPEVVRMSREAADASAAGDWDRAEGMWRAVLQRIPGDGVAGAHLERIAGYRTTPPPPDWDGAVTLEGKR